VVVPQDRGSIWKSCDTLKGCKAMSITGLVQLLFDLYIIVLLARVLLSWVQVDPRNPIVNLIHQLTEPLLAPIRRLLPQSGALDFSPMVALIVVRVAEQIVLTLLRSILR
jgi:YggT family protein